MIADTYGYPPEDPETRRKKNLFYGAVSLAYAFVLTIIWTHPLWPNAAG